MSEETTQIVYRMISFFLIMHKKFMEGELVHFIDSSPKTEHTCCKGQWHEYHKHGCEAGISFDDWWTATKECINSFNPDKEFIRSCRYDRQEHCNFPEEVTNVNLSHTIGCVNDKPVCKYICSEYVNPGFCNWYLDAGKKFKQGVRFLVPNVYTPDPIVESPNCYC